MTLRETFQDLRGRNEQALIAYMTAGFPSLSTSIENQLLLATHGADIVEIGIPFSDPVADGMTIQYASHMALEKGFRLPDLLASLKGMRMGCPLVAMSYLNPLLAYDRDVLLGQMTDGGITGLIIPDLPVEESSEWLASCRKHGMSLIFLAAPTSTESRIRAMAECSDGFLYYVSVMGTTGSRKELSVDLKGSLQQIKALTDKPIAVGFGISRPDHIRSLRGLADGVVVGSRFIEAVRQGEDLVQLVGDLKDATKESLPC